MAFKPNYRMQRADRERAKEEKLKKKLQRRAEKDADATDTPIAALEPVPTELDEGEAGS
jgi:hypothetical protein